MADDDGTPDVTSTDNSKEPSPSDAKKRKLHMDHLDCRDFTEHEGGERLKNPNSVSFSSRDPNRGLYPRVSRKNPGPAAMGSGFITASEAMNPTLPFVNASQLHAPSKPAEVDSNEKQPPSWWKPKKPKSKLPGQSNTLDRYCVKTTAPSSTVTSSSSSTSLSSSSSATAVSKSQSYSNGCSQSSQSSSLSSSPSSSQSKTTLMYKPIRKMEDDTSSIFYDGSPTKSVNQKLFDAQKPKPKTKKSKKPPPKFNRDNKFLYSQDPIPKNSTASKSSTFGLLGNEDDIWISSEEEQEDICWFDYLPLEVMENILCRLPMLDLCLNVNQVCKQWNEIISSDKFVPWKKRYFRLKKFQDEVQQEMSDIMMEHDMLTPPNFLPGLIRYMKEFGPMSRRANMMECLEQRHPKFMWAKDLLAERFPECYVKEGELSPWSVVAVLVTVLSERVRDVEQVLWSLINNPNSQCTAQQLLQVLYGILCFLFMFKKTRRNGVWNGMHYRLFYALYLFENESCTTLAQLENVFKDSSGQQSLLKYSKRDSSMQYTHEQLRICSYSVQPGDVVKIVAFAGTGKTTTLVRYTQLRPNKRFLLVVYNKAIKEHASQCFPGNVTCKTGHGLAFGDVGRRFAARPGKLGNLRVYPLTQVLKMRKGESVFIQAKFVMDTIHAYLASADDTIGPQHVPEEHVDDRGKRVQVDHVMRENLVSDAKAVWEMMQDLRNTRVPMTHDGYLKLYQLKRPRLNNYDVILIDEAQDLTPAIADILLSQRQPKVLVGDPHQQIYAFRGAVNAMSHLPASHTFYLTQSFRFGPEIAFAAATCLELLKGEKEKTLVGNKHQGGLYGSVSGQVAVITRTNFRLFVRAVEVCSQDRDPAFKIAFAGGIENFGIDMIMDIYLLMLPPEERQGKGEIKNKLIKNFPSIGELEKYANKTMDHELAGKIKIVLTFNTALPAHVAKIKARLTKDESTADMIFSTAHKAKGLEFPSVELTDDYNIAPEPGQRVSEDEFNLLYVAITRAKRRIVVTRTVLGLLERAGEKFIYPDYTKPRDISGESAPKLRCVQTDREFTPLALTLTQREIKLSSGSVISGGPLCPQLVTEEMASVKALYGALTDERENAEEQQ